MTILLINNNPIVSRLFALCQEEDAIVLDEFADISSIGEEYYDIIFIDESSYTASVASYMLNLKYKVLISYEDKSILGFDETVKKPFLPSQIMDIVQDIQAKETLSSPILNTKELDTIKELLLMNDEPISPQIEEDEENFSLEELALIEESIKEAISKMKNKKIKKFLKGKKINMKIQIKKQI